MDLRLLSDSGHSMAITGIVLMQRKKCVCFRAVCNALVLNGGPGCHKPVIHSVNNNVRGLMKKWGEGRLNPFTATQPWSTPFMVGCSQPLQQTSCLTADN